MSFVCWWVREIERSPKESEKHHSHPLSSPHSSLARLRAEEDHLYGDKEVFVTAAYKEKLIEREAARAATARADADEAAAAPATVGDMGGFYRNLLTDNVALGMVKEVGGGRPTAAAAAAPPPPPPPPPPRPASVERAPPVTTAPEARPPSAVEAAAAAAPPPPPLDDIEARAAAARARFLARKQRAAGRV